ncbi:hypothetical protein MPSEU_001030900 [Mayamaea pseudoterrestris]|nr:hypothetical protein MPSEU_001030900 [Mayamaea pseudoterrestris]
MNQLLDIIAASSFFNVATEILSKLPNQSTQLLQEELAHQSFVNRLYFAISNCYEIVMTTTGILLLLFLATLAKPFQTIRWRRNAKGTAKRVVPEPTIVGATLEDESTTRSSQQRPQQWMQMWNDFTSPLTYLMSKNFSDSLNETDISDEFVLTPRPCNVLHFCFLMHGHRGYSQDLAYLSAQMRKVALAKFAKQSDGSNEQFNDIVLHAMVCNEKKTTDGVVNGGERAIEEMLEVIRRGVLERQAMENDTLKCQDITISVLGNSLGGIYARYAVAKLTERWNCTTGTEDEQSTLFATMNNRTFRVHYNVFCTTATPHLGIAGHTFLPIPRSAEIGVAHAMGNTGRDLFRCNDLLKDMATRREYLEPLGRFRKRIAYANAYGTDFPVPAHTAAFLSETSTYPHHFSDNCNASNVVVEDGGLVVATLHTPASSEYSSGTDSTDLQMDAWDDDSEDRSELELMSQSLDALGWKKVFIDVRKEIPKIALPISFIRKTVTQMTSGGEVNESLIVVDEEASSPELIEQLRERGVVGSKDIAAAVTVPLFDEQFHWPMGHNMIVAFSRSKFSAYMNKAGRPVVDALAKALVEEIFAWQLPRSTEQGHIEG